MNQEIFCRLIMINSFHMSQADDKHLQCIHYIYFGVLVDALEMRHGIKLQMLSASLVSRKEEFHSIYTRMWKRIGGFLGEKMQAD